MHDHTLKYWRGHGKESHGKNWRESYSNYDNTILLQIRGLEMSSKRTDDREHGGQWWVETTLNLLFCHLWGKTCTIVVQFMTRIIQSRNTESGISNTARGYSMLIRFDPVIAGSDLPSLSEPLKNLSTRVIFCRPLWKMDSYQLFVKGPHSCTKWSDLK